MVLYIVGLGLADERDITLRGLDAVRGSVRVYLEAYTSILLVGKEKLEELYGKEVIVADREMVESNSDAILAGADVDDVAFCVVGDPYGATTHADLAARARAAGVPVRVIHNASILNAAGAAELSLYRYGETVSLVFFTDGWRPDSFYERVAANRARGLHTLLLLDIKVKEPTDESLARGKPVYLPPRYMSVFTAARQLLEVEAARKEGAYGPDTIAIAIARAGAPDGTILAATLAEFAGGAVPEAAVGPPLHSLVLPGDMHDVEADAVAAVRWKKDDV